MWKIKKISSGLQMLRGADNMVDECGDGICYWILTSLSFSSNVLSTKSKQLLVQTEPNENQLMICTCLLIDCFVNSKEDTFDQKIYFCKKLFKISFFFF